MTEWFDNTSYAPGARGRIEPVSWHLRAGKIGISATRRGEDVWFVICGDVGIHDYKPLQAKTAVDAQAEAIEVVRDRLREKLNAVPRKARTHAEELVRDGLKEMLRALPRKPRVVKR